MRGNWRGLKSDISMWCARDYCRYFTHCFSYFALKISVDVFGGVGPGGGFCYNWGSKLSEHIEIWVISTYMRPVC